MSHRVLYRDAMGHIRDRESVVETLRLIADQIERGRGDVVYMDTSFEVPNYDAPEMHVDIDVVGTTVTDFLTEELDDD